MIYLIDNDVSMLRAFQFFLESAGMNYNSYETEQSFLAKGKPLAGDLIVLDLSMPRIKSMEILKKICQAYLQIPILVVTVFDDDQFREFCKQYGVKGIMRKPVDGEALIDLIKYNLHVTSNPFNT